MRATWRMLAGRRDLRLVLISLTGDWILTIGLVYRVYAMTGSTVASALTMASVFAPQVLLGAVAGVFADRWDRKRTMIAADLLLAAGLMPLLLVRGPAQIWIVFAVRFWEGSVEQFFSPAEQAMVPRLVPDDELLTASAVSGQVSNVSRLAGSALGGVLAAAGGLPAVTLADAATFLASATLLALVRTSGRTASRAGGGPVRARLAQVRAEWRDGLRLATRHRVLRALMIFALVTSVGEGMMSTLFTPFVEHVLHGTAQDLGFILAAQAIGGIAGGMVAAACGHRMRAARMLCFGAVVFGLVDLAISLPARLRRRLARGHGDDHRRRTGGAHPGRTDHAVPAQQRGLLPGPRVRRRQRPGRCHRAGRDAGRGVPEPAGGHRPGAGHPGRRLYRGRPGHALAGAEESRAALP